MQSFIIYHLNRGRKRRQVTEVTVGNPAEAGDVRRRSVERVQVQDDRQGAVVNLQQTPAAKLRVDIMKILSKRLTEELVEGRRVTVIPHLSRPVLILEENGRRRPFTYVEVVRNFKYLLQMQDKKNIHDRMRTIGFKGDAERSFAVLEDLDSESWDSGEASRKKPEEWSP
jgi:hypothetical protein